MVTANLQALHREGRHLAVAWANGRREQVFDALWAPALTKIEAIVVAMAIFTDLAAIAGTDPSGFLEALEERVG